MAEHLWIDRALRDLAATIEFPATPNLSASLTPDPQPSSRAKKLAMALALVMVIGAAVPPVRSAMVDWVKAGAVTLYRWFGEENLSDTAPADAFLSRVAKPVSLADAQTAFPHPLALPTHPGNLGSPAEFWLLDEVSGPTVISIWRDHAGDARLVLYQIAASDLIRKNVREWREVPVNGRAAIWTSGPHLMRLPDGVFENWALIRDNVLIWTSQTGLTYRLETRLGQRDAVAIAESLQAVPEPEP